MGQPRIFVSHSHKDEDFTQRVVDDLHRAGAEVWVDVAGISHGNFMQHIDDALAHCDWLVLVLTPNAVASPYVKSEVYAALMRANQGFMRDVIPVLAAPCAPGSIPPQWDLLHRYDATQNYEVALDGVLGAVGLPTQKPLAGGSRASLVSATATERYVRSVDAAPIRQTTLSTPLIAATVTNHRDGVLSRPRTRWRPSYPKLAFIPLACYALAALVIVTAQRTVLEAVALIGVTLVTAFLISVAKALNTRSGLWTVALCVSAPLGVVGYGIPTIVTVLAFSLGGPVARKK